MKSSKENLETKGIRSMLIFEIIGRPAENLIKTLENIIKQIDEEKKVEVKSKDIKEPTPLKDQEGFFTTFAEIEVEVEDIQYLALLMFKYMPAHIEVVSPELVALTNNGWGDILSELTRRLHAYDEVARVLRFQNNQLKEKLTELMPKDKKKKPEKKDPKEK
ncbi:hypothetical protein KAI04_02665 [Candidatus Pacearchaeota archaeon]|nr:hypothetical protein [Candidatus Pacearchaeota archaeon]